MSKIFKAARGARFDDEKAQAYGDYLSELSEKKGQMLTTEEVLDAARPEKSPIHGYFQWDDSLAAESWRMVQARNLVNHIEIQVVDVYGERQTKAFHSIEVEVEGVEARRYYVSVEMVGRDEYLRSKVIAGALAELKRWEMKYRDYKELESIFGEIAKVQKKLQFEPAENKARV